MCWSVIRVFDSGVMPRNPGRPKELVGKVFRGTFAVQKGLLTRSQLRSGAWRPLFRDVYADQSLPITHRMRCSAVSEYLMPEGAVIAGRSAAHLYGSLARDVGDPVEVLCPKAFGPVTGLIVHRGVVPEEEVKRVGPSKVTSPQRTCADLARWLDTVEAVAVVDALIANRMVGIADLLEYAQAKRGQAGAARLMKVARLADGAAESPQESRLRVLLVLAGLPQPVTQRVINHEGRFVARVDMAWDEYKIALEYDGARHTERRELEHGRARLAKLVSLGWIVLHVTGLRMRDDFPGVLAEIRAALRSRRR